MSTATIALIVAIIALLVAWSHGGRLDAVEGRSDSDVDDTGADLEHRVHNLETSADEGRLDDLEARVDLLQQAAQIDDLESRVAFQTGTEQHGRLDALESRVEHLELSDPQAPVERIKKPPKGS